MTFQLQSRSLFLPPRISSYCPLCILSHPPTSSRFLHCTISSNRPLPTSPERFISQCLFSQVNHASQSLPPHTYIHIYPFRDATTIGSPCYPLLAIKLAMVLFSGRDNSSLRLLSVTTRCHDTNPVIFIAILPSNTNVRRYPLRDFAGPSNNQSTPPLIAYCQQSLENPRTGLMHQVRPEPNRPTGANSGGFNFLTGSFPNLIPLHGFQIYRFPFETWPIPQFLSGAVKVRAYYQLQLSAE